MTIFEATEDSIKIDVASLSRGDYISPADISAAYGVEVGTNKYSFTLMGIGAYIEKWSEDDGDPLVVKGENYGLRILGHEEASDYLWTRFRARLAGMRRDDKRYRSIKSFDFDSEKKREHEHRAHVIRTVTTMATSTTKKLGVPTNDTPSLPGIDS